MVSTVTVDVVLEYGDKGPVYAEIWCINHSLQVWVGDISLNQKLLVILIKTFFKKR